MLTPDRCSRGGLDLPRPAPGPLARHHDTGDEQLATPDAPRLVPLQRPGQAGLPDRAGLAQCLRELDVRGKLREPELGVVDAAGSLRGSGLQYVVGQAVE